ncbi:bacteriorhodopsin [Xylariomycetidae sp. FL2044]|nr:bacteriorhodopsin [Xylariomycetidae sp. FL2044]
MVVKRNDAVRVNDPVGDPADLEITDRGSDWYYTVCAIMGFSAILFMVLALRKPQTHRIFHYINAAIAAIACIAYFSMGSNLGKTAILAEFRRPDDPQVRSAGTREIFYARYIDWAITTPLLLLDLLLTAGIPTPTILVTLLADEIMIVCGLVGALTYTRYKWGYFAFGCAAFFFIIYELGYDGVKHAKALGKPKKPYLMCTSYLLFLWMLYPIAWGLSEGGNVIHPDSEAIFYGILDILAKPVFAGLLLWSHRNISPHDLGLHIRNPDPSREKYAGGAAGDGVHPEGPGSNAVGAGHPAAPGTNV